MLLRARRRFAEGCQAGKAQLALGSFLIACTLGCRPQCILSAALIVAIFWPDIRAGRFFSRAGLGNTLAVIAPFFVVAVPVCFYNAARFGSPFDFGASYNLTGADMTAYSFDPVVAAARLLEYLFLPPVVQAGYPFLHAIDDVSGLPAALWTNEPVFGGFFAFAPAALAVSALLGKKTRCALADRGVSGVCAACAALAIAILMVVGSVSGTTMRYFADFAWLIIVPALMVIWDVMARERAQGRVRFSGWLAAAVLADCRCTAGRSSRRRASGRSSLLRRGFTTASKRFCVSCNGYSFLRESASCTRRGTQQIARPIFCSAAFICASNLDWSASISPRLQAISSSRLAS